MLDLKCTNRPTLKDITLATVWDALLAADLPAQMAMLSRCLLYNLCPLSIIDEMSMHLLNLYNTVGGTSRLATAEEFYRQPAKYIMACNVIESERSKIADAAKKEK